MSENEDYEHDVDMDSDEFHLEMETDDSNNPFYVPADTYPAYVAAVSKDWSKAGNPMWVWDFALLEREPNDPHATKELRSYTALTPAAMWKVAEVLEALELGENGEDGKFRANFKKADAINRRCLLVVEDQEYEGRTNSSIAQILPHPDGAVAKKSNKGSKRRGRQPAGDPPF